MKKTTLLASAAILVSSFSFAQAGLIEDVVYDLNSRGFSLTAIEDNGTTVTFKGARYGLDYEVVYDKATGAVLSGDTDGRFRDLGRNNTRAYRNGSGRDGGSFNNGSGRDGGSFNNGSNGSWRNGGSSRNNGSWRSGRGSGGGGVDTAWNMEAPIDYLTGGQGDDIDFD